MSLSARSVNADKRGSGSISAFFMSEESQLRVVRLTGVITLDSSTVHLAQSGYIRLPVSSRAFHQGLISMFVVTSIYHNIFNRLRSISPSRRRESPYCSCLPRKRSRCGHVGIDRLHCFVRPNDV